MCSCDSCDLRDLVNVKAHSGNSWKFVAVVRPPTRRTSAREAQQLQGPDEFELVAELENEPTWCLYDVYMMSTCLSEDFVTACYGLLLCLRNPATALRVNRDSLWLTEGHSAPSSTHLASRSQSSFDMPMETRWNDYGMICCTLSPPPSAKIAVTKVQSLGILLYNSTGQSEVKQWDTERQSKDKDNSINKTASSSVLKSICSNLVELKYSLFKDHISGAQAPSCATRA